MSKLHKKSQKWPWKLAASCPSIKCLYNVVKTMSCEVHSSQLKHFRWCQCDTIKLFNFDSPTNHRIRHPTGHVCSYDNLTMDKSGRIYLENAPATSPTRQQWCWLYSFLVFLVESTLLQATIRDVLLSVEKNVINTDTIHEKHFPVCGQLWFFSFDHKESRSVESCRAMAKWANINCS